MVIVAIIIEQGVEVASPVFGGESVISVEAAGVRVVWGLGGAVPFSEYSAAWVVVSGLEFRRGGNPGGLKVKICELGTFAGECGCI